MSVYNIKAGADGFAKSTAPALLPAPVTISLPEDAQAVFTV